MEKELLEIVINEYAQMTGLENVTADTCVKEKHVVSLKKRLSINGGFMILKDAKLDTVNDFVVAIDAGFDAYANYACQVVEIAEALSKTNYSHKDALFDDCCLREQCKYRYLLCKKISSRYQIEFDEKVDSLHTAEDFARYIFKRVNVQKTLI